MFNKTLFENGVDIHPLFFQQDGDTDITGDWVSLRDYSRVYVLLIKAGSEDVDTGVLQLLQATAADGTGSKALSVQRAWYKTGTMTGQGTWTPVTVANSLLGFGSSLTVTAGTADRVVADVNTSPVYILAEIRAEDLDVANGFKFATAFIEGDESNNAVLYSALAIFSHGSLPQAIPLSPLA